MIFQCIHQTQSSLTTRCQHCFLMNMWYPGSHSDNLVCKWDPLDPLKSDPDCQGHLTHFQPCCECFSGGKHTKLLHTVKIFNQNGQGNSYSVGFPDMRARGGDFPHKGTQKEYFGSVALKDIAKLNPTWTYESTIWCENCLLFMFT